MSQTTAALAVTVLAVLLGAVVVLQIVILRKRSRLVPTDLRVALDQLSSKPVKPDELEAYIRTAAAIIIVQHAVRIREDYTALLERLSRLWLQMADGQDVGDRAEKLHIRLDYLLKELLGLMTEARSFVEAAGDGPGASGAGPAPEALSPAAKPAPASTTT